MGAWPMSDERLRAMYAGGRADERARRFARLWAAVFGLGLMPRRWVTLEVAGRRSGQVTRSRSGWPTGTASGTSYRCLASSATGSRTCAPRGGRHPCGAGAASTVGSPRYRSASVARSSSATLSRCQGAARTYRWTGMRPWQTSRQSRRAIPSSGSSSIHPGAAQAALVAVDTRQLRGPGRPCRCGSRQVAGSIPVTLSDWGIKTPTGYGFLASRWPRCGRAPAGPAPGHAAPRLTS